MKKKLLSALLVCAMALSLLPAALAAEDDAAVPGSDLASRVSPAILEGKDTSEKVCTLNEIGPTSEKTIGANGVKYLEVPLTVKGLKKHQSTDDNQSGQGKIYYFGINVKSPGTDETGALEAHVAIQKDAADFNVTTLEGKLTKDEELLEDGSTAIYLGYTKPVPKVDAFWIMVRWKDSEGNPIATDLIKLVPDISFVVDNVDASVINVGYKHDVDKARKTISEEVEKGLNPTAAYEPKIADDNSDIMWAIFKVNGTNKNGQKFKVVATHNGNKVAEGPVHTMADASKGGCVYFSFQGSGSISNKLEEGVYTFTLYYESGSENWIKIDDKNLIVYKVQFAVENGSLASGAENGGFAMAEDADSVPKPEVTAASGYAAAEEWVKSTNGYTVTYTMTCVSSTPDKDPDKTPTRILTKTPIRIPIKTLTRILTVRAPTRSGWITGGTAQPLQATPPPIREPG